MLMYVSSKPALLRVFIINRGCTLSNALSASIEMIIWFLSFLLLIYHVDCFANIEPPHCIPGGPMRDSIPGLQDHDLSVKADAQPLNHPGVPCKLDCFPNFSFCYYFSGAEKHKGYMYIHFLIL